MSNDEQPESLAAQAAAWVPPWERPAREPDRAFQQAVENAARAEHAGDEERAEADLSDDDDDFDEASKGGEPSGNQGVLDDEPDHAVVDAPAGDDDLESTEVPVGPELPVPGAVEEAEGEPGIDEPLSPDGDDAGDVFDAAADDDVSDDDDVDLPVGEEPDEPAAAYAVPGQSSKARGSLPSRTGGKVTEAGAEAPGSDLPGLADDAELAAALEAILLVVDEPVAEMQLAQILEQPTERVAATLDDISARYTAAGHGFDLRRAAGGWRLYTRPEYAAYVERFVLDGQSVRLTQAALETLAVVAYKQPVTRSRISAIRGVNCDGVMRTLVTRGLIEECGTEGETGAHLYRTTPLFLEKLGLNSVDQLPPLAPFLPDDVEEVLDASG
nr:SMC-Scp complex subunit ScpB [uncultured Actinoplanes sp.]